MPLTKPPILSFGSCLDDNCFGRLTIPATSSTYSGQLSFHPGSIDHSVIHTTIAAPNLLPDEVVTKYSIQVQSTEGEYLRPESRVNYGKAYAVEHNVKVLDVGMVIENHRYLLKQYFDAAMQAD